MAVNRRRSTSDQSLLRGRQEQTNHCLGSVAVEILDVRRVGVEDERHGRVSQARTDNLRVYPVPQRDRRVGVPYVVELNLRQPEGIDDPVELLRDGVRIVGRPSGSAERQTVVLIGVAPVLFLLLHLLEMHGQHPGGEAVQLEQPAALLTLA